MRTLLPVIAIATVGVGGLLFACTVNSTTNNNVPPAGDDGGTPASSDDSSAPPSADAGPDAENLAVDAAAEAATPQAFVRVAHWSPDAPAVDVCFTQQGSGWTGQVPQLAQIVAAAADAGSLSDGGIPGVAFPQVTSYLIISPGVYSVRLVAAGAADCGTSVVDLASLTLTANTYTTVAAVGEQTPVSGDQALTLVSFTDEVSAPAGQIALRFINASPSPSLTPSDLGTGSLAGTGGPFAPLFTGVSFGQTGSVAGNDAGTVDANGYIASTPLATATLSAHPSASATDATVAVNDVSIAATSAATVALINGVSNGQASSAVKLLQCSDADDSMGTSLLSTCSIISTQ
jgi:Domain of unknown function (DUF4397)